MRFLLLALALAAPLSAQQPAADHPVSTPYAGDLSIFETPGREDRLQIDRVMDLLKIRQGSAVADIGAGSGWFSVRAARRVGARGVVYAEDINQEYVDYIKQRASKEHLPQVKTVLGTPDDPMLPRDGVDAVMMLKVYHEIAEPKTVLARLRAAMRPGALFGIIDRNGAGDDHGLKEKIVTREVVAAGFKLVGRYDFTKADGQDYFLIFTPVVTGTTPAGLPPRPVAPAVRVPTDR